MFFDIDGKKVVEVDCLEKERRYAGVVGDEYLVFEAHEYIPDPESGKDAIATKNMIYYFVKTEELR